MREFHSFMDLTRQGRTLDCHYHGSNDDLLLEGRIMSEDGPESLVVGITVSPRDVAHHDYDHRRFSLDIWYKSPPPEEIRAGLEITKFTTHKDIRAINVFDVGQPLPRT